MKTKELKAKFLRFIGITKPIELSKEDIQWIKLYKGHLDKDPRFTGAKTFSEKTKILFKEIYGWDPDEYKYDYLDCIFKKLFDLYMKIQSDRSGSHIELKELFGSAFKKGYFITQEDPQERTITSLQSLIRNVLVFEDGVKRFHL